MCTSENLLEQIRLGHVYIREPSRTFWKLLGHVHMHHTRSRNLPDPEELSRNRAELYHRLKLLRLQVKDFCPYR